MTIGGALSDLNNLLKADDIPSYYKPSIKAVMDTIALEQEPSKGEKTNETDKEIHGVREELKAIEKELHNLNRILEKRKI